MAESVYTEKRSKFIAIALPVRTLTDVKNYLEEYQKKYYDARHVCYAYMLDRPVRIFGPMIMESLQEQQENRFWGRSIPMS